MAAFDTYCVAPFKQKFPIQKHFPSDHPLNYGICFGLGLEWMARHKKNKAETPQKRIEYIGNDSTILHASIKQRLYIAELEAQLDQTDGQVSSKSPSLDLYGMKISSTAVARVDVNDKARLKAALSAVDVGTAATHTYHALTLVFDVQGLAHAVCCYKSGGKAFGFGSHLYFFEPNFGEYKAAAGSVTDMFNGLVDEYRAYRRANGTLMTLKIEKIVVQRITFG